MFLCYRLYNNKTGETYIGLTTRQLSIRMSEHLSDAFAKRKNTLISCAIRKSGSVDEAKKLWSIEPLHQGDNNTTDAKASAIEAMLIQEESKNKGDLCLNMRSRGNDLQLALNFCGRG